jgi:hypothetical protein
VSQWFAAHLILYVKLKDRPQKSLPVWENIVLIHAETEEEAFEKAERRGAQEAGDDGGTFRWGGKPAEWVFAGVRKLTLCQDADERPRDGTEISYTEFSLASQEALEKLVNNEPVGLRLRERLRD